MIPSLLPQQQRNHQKPHENFFIFSGENNRDLGQKMGEAFRFECQASIDTSSRHPLWIQKKGWTHSHLAFHEKHFPQYMDELRGYASGAQVNFIDLFALSLEDELDLISSEHCTSIVAGKGTLIGHNEDWDEHSENRICIVQKTIQGVTILELYYHNTLGGNAVSINSYGFISMVNSLPCRRLAPGISKNFIARFLSETKDPSTDSKRISEIPRMSPYSITLVRNAGEIINIEFDNERVTIEKPNAPFIHTNHFLFQENLCTPDPTSTTFHRFDTASKNIRNVHSIETLEKLTGTQVGGDFDIFNPRTLARVLIDTEKKQVNIWLRREAKKGFVTYLSPS